MSHSIQKDLVRVIRALGVTFTLNEKPITVEEVLASTGLLPAIARRADQLSALCLGYGLGISFEESENALLGVKVIFDDVTPGILRYLCILDIVNELIKCAPSSTGVSLDELMYD